MQSERDYTFCECCVFEGSVHSINSVCMKGLCIQGALCVNQ